MVKPCFVAQGFFPERKTMIDLRKLLTLVSAIIFLSTLSGTSLAAGDAKRGAYLAKIANCVGCHTEDRAGAVPYAGGRALKTPFGTFFGPNITPDRVVGIGSWSETDFTRAMRFGVRPDKAAYFPSFPYHSYTKITDNDLQDLWAYLLTLKPEKLASRPHELGFFFQWRFSVQFWKWSFFTPGPFENDPDRSVLINRGAYLVQAVGHCGECHTPRTVLGGPKKNRSLAGGKGPEGRQVPNLTPARLKKWSDRELKYFFATGILPDGDMVAKTMAEVIKNSTSQLTAADLSAIIAYLRSLPVIEDHPQ